MAKISLAIPYHDTPQTAFYLSRLMNSIASQSFTDYEIVLTKEGAFARNHNAAILKCTGQYVQMLGIDDYFADTQSLARIVDGLEKSGKEWQISACGHDFGGQIGNPHFPHWTDDIFKGNNRLGGVSTLSFVRDKALLFEEPLTWLVDVDLYYRLYLKYGLPHLIQEINLIINVDAPRTSNTLSEEIKIQEINYLTKKYGK